MHIELAHPIFGGTAPDVVHALFACTGRDPTLVRLTGDPLLDFARIDISGPSYTGQIAVAKKPKPHSEPIPNWKKVPLTTYGKWLAKHPVKGLKWKTYALKPGVVYKYAVPINLSCQYDMSLPGVYHVRVELANPHIWSPWMDVTVPQN